MQCILYTVQFTIHSIVHWTAPKRLIVLISSSYFLADFSSGAMENFGLITYRESVVLFDKKSGSVTQLYQILYVIAHELAHQWFGNLVTPNYWEDIWLNEGFATYMLYEAIDAIKPEWNVFDRFVLDKYHEVLSIDAMRNSHSISYTIKYSNDVGQLFDS